LAGRANTYGRPPHWGDVGDDCRPRSSGRHSSGAFGACLVARSTSATRDS
jgi:hypothetical protein